LSSKTILFKNVIIGNDSIPDVYVKSKFFMKDHYVRCTDRQINTWKDIS